MGLLIGYNINTHYSAWKLDTTNWYEKDTLAIYGFNNKTSWIGVCVDYSQYPTVDDFKAFLQAQHAAGTPLKVYFETSQSSQLQGQLHLHKGTNILTSTATVEPTGMTAEYYSSKEV